MLSLQSANLSMLFTKLSLTYTFFFALKVTCPAPNKTPLTFDDHPVGSYKTFFAPPEI